MAEGGPVGKHIVSVEAKGSDITVTWRPAQPSEAQPSTVDVESQNRPTEASEHTIFRLVSVSPLGVKHPDPADAREFLQETLKHQEMFPLMNLHGSSEKVVAKAIDVLGGSLTKEQSVPQQIQKDLKLIADVVKAGEFEKSKPVMAAVNAANAKANSAGVSFADLGNVISGHHEAIAKRIERELR